jgi:acetoin utilization protein AcuB
MLLHQLISPDVPQVAPTDTIDYISSLFFASQLRQIPVIQNEQYLGLIDAKELQILQEASEELQAKLYENFRPAISIHAHPFEAMRILHLYELSILPVLGEDAEYVGSITQEGLLAYLVEHINIEVNGGIIVLEMEPRNYSLSQIARICENEQVLILGAQAKTNIDTAKLEVTLKTNSIDLSAVIQALERFEYTVLDTYGDQKIENDTNDRYRLLMNYINM